MVNENDVTTIEALTFGGNDMLAAEVASMVSADYLVIFTDVDGLLKEGKVMPVVEKIDDSIKALPEDRKINTPSAVWRRNWKPRNMRCLRAFQCL